MEILKSLLSKVRNKIHCISPHLKAYQNEVWDFIINFHTFNIVSIPRLKNVAVDLLATSASRLVPSNNRFSIELLFRPSVLDMITKLWVISNFAVFDE